MDVGISGVSKRSMRISFRLSGFSRGAFELLDHSYEVDKRFRVHLLDCPAALDFHGTLRSSKLVPNLFIGACPEATMEITSCSREVNEFEAPLEDTSRLYPVHVSRDLAPLG